VHVKVEHPKTDAILDATYNEPVTQPVQQLALGCKLGSRFPKKKDFSPRHEV
jgi:hypothetical protein